jgi:hypothetical protein
VLVLCAENGSINHLFFECAIAKAIWSYVEEFLGYEIGTYYISIASKWLHKDKFYGASIISIALLWDIWLNRNDFVFNKQVWSDVRIILRRIMTLTREWKVIFKEAKMEEMMGWSYFLEKQIRGPLRLERG